MKKKIEEIERDESLPLHIKYRPKTFGEFVGNESTVKAINTILLRDKGEVRSFLFTGSSGCGKTTVARIVKDILECSDKDFKEYNTANTRGIDTIREISENCRFAPWSGKVRIYLLDECHKLTGDGQNALLKLLEDTPKHVRFILCTTDPEKLLLTIRNRCSKFHLKTLRSKEIMKILLWICSEEGVEKSDEVLQKICSCADGSARQAVVMLDQIIDIEDEEEAFQVIVDMTVNEENILSLCQELLKNSPKWEVVSKIVEGIADEPEKVRYSVLNYMSRVILNKNTPRAIDVIEAFMDNWMYIGKAGLIYSTYILCKINNKF